MGARKAQWWYNREFDWWQYAVKSTMTEQNGFKRRVCGNQCPFCSWWSSIQKLISCFLLGVRGEEKHLPDGIKQVSLPLDGLVVGQCLLLVSSWEELEMPFWFWVDPEPNPYNRPQYFASSMLSSKKSCKRRQLVSCNSQDASSQTSFPSFHSSKKTWQV